MEMRFTASVVEALEFVLKLERGNLFVYPKGTDFSKKPFPSPQRIEAPVWCNFGFFSRIKASPIRTTKQILRAETTCGWKFKRHVEFFHHGTRVAIVNLVGEKYGNVNPSGFDNESFWAVSSFGYLRSQGTPIPGDWEKVECANAGMTLRCIF